MASLAVEGFWVGVIAHLEHLRGANRCGTSLIGVLWLSGGAAGGWEVWGILKLPSNDHALGP